MSLLSPTRKPTNEASFSSAEELLESEDFFDTLRACKVDCLVAHSEDNLVHSLAKTFLGKHGPKSEKLAESILTPESVSRILLDFFKYVGCSIDQFVAIVPKLYRTLLEHNQSTPAPLHPESLSSVSSTSPTRMHTRAQKKQKILTSTVSS